MGWVRIVRIVGLKSPAFCCGYVKADKKIMNNNNNNNMFDVYFCCLYTKRLLFVYFSFSFDLVFDFVFRLNCITIVMLSCPRNILDLET